MPWLIVPDAEQEDDIKQIDVLPGQMVDGRPTYDGHDRGSGCDCRPTTLPRVNLVIVVHRSVV